ncbi:MAG: RNA polymerase sigma factor [Candidatus Magasanikbacteria bacterium GW2011_GWA2_45_39]|uniref:RNA polymerase sigma factor n=1 Tax=Candidatus Magasanikbacteria bacterium GW2011_GWA2_45_39 TaxID=1619041 RepID=A0A0G1MI69_9BACT|nr:MAG: RNA polymerase sigma factor [Candidatus Magasanikbacteria bacterium GW2011_GWA2_45_39]
MENVLSDNELICAYKKGEVRALEDLIRRYLNQVFGFVYRYIGDAREAEDITQDVFVRVWKNMRKFDDTKSFKTWVFSIAKNASIDFLRKKKSVPFASFETEEGENPFADIIEDTSPLPEELVARKHLAEEVAQAIATLPSPFRVIVHLYHEQQYTLQEAADFLGEPINTVKSRYRRAISALRKKLINSTLSGQLIKAP